MTWHPAWQPGQINALLAERQLKQRMRDAGVDPANPAEREAWEAGHAAAMTDAIAFMLTVRDRYAQFSRGDDDIFRVLENWMAPLEPGEPVQFQEGCQRRWLNGTFGGPVDNPGDPQRAGDFWVTATASGRRVPVFGSSVRRRGGV
jgi:hypothetical protein